MPTENKPAVLFQREDRYIVIKRSDIERLSPGDCRVATRHLRDLHEELFKVGAPARSFVVVEDDWPEYHLVWAMIEHRMAGKPVPDFNLWRRADELQQRLNAADQRIDELTHEREGLIAYGRSRGLDEASTLCSRLAYDTYYPAGSRFKHFIPKALEQQGNLLIKAANAIASLPDGPYDRFKARQLKALETPATT